MTRRYLPLLLMLTALWGSSFLFVEIALEEVEPATLMLLRLVLSAIALAAVLALRSGVGGAAACLRAAWFPLVVLGVINASVPFTLIAWGQKHIDSGIAAIANSSVPIFVALLAIRFLPSERVTGLRAVGIGLGLLGVAVLAGGNPEGGWWAVGGTLAVVAASFLYAVSSLFAQTHVAETDGLVLATGSTLVASLVLAPLGIAQAPAAVPGWETWAAISVLGLGGVALGQVVYYRLLEDHGSTRASLVTYLMPVMALVLGIVFLDEPLTVAAVAGLALVLSGVALGSGLWRPARRREPVTVHAP